jgi:hypothetical protein
MGDAKDIVLRPIDRKEADAAVKRWHYSGKVVNNTQLSIGVFYGGRLEGAMQFGPSLDKRKIMGLVAGTGWNEFVELNRMAFSDRLPRNSESRALSVSMRLIRKHAPHIKWVISFADATQCGDGAIYRAAGFALTGIRTNTSIWVAPDEASTRFSRTSLTDNRSHTEQARAQAISGARISRTTVTKAKYIVDASLQTHPQSAGAGGGASMKAYIEAGFKPLEGFQLRYIYFIDRACRAALTVPELPFSAIAAAGAGMYRGEKRAGADGGDPDQQGGGSSILTPALSQSIGSDGL